MKKIKNILLTLLLVVLSIQPLSAASGNISISAPGTVTVGDSFTVTVSYSASEQSAYELQVSGGGTVSGGGPIAADTAGSATFTMVANSIGRGSVSVSGQGSSLSDPENPFNMSGSVSINVVAKQTESKPEQPGNGGTETPNYPTEEYPVGLTPEEEAAAKEAEEQAAKELAQKTPLLSSIEVVSMSEKKNNQSLVVVKPEVDTWEYAYALPKRIDKYRLSVLGVDDDVVITFDADHEFKEGDAATKDIAIRAVKGDIIQEYVFKVNKDVSVPTVVELDGKQITIFEDDELDAFMKESGFERKTYKGSNDAEIPFFSIDKVNIQLVLNEDKQAQWHLLDDKNVIGERVSLQFDVNKKPLFILEAPEEISGQTYKGNKYENVSGKVEDLLLNLDSTVKWLNDYKAWSVNDASIVYAMGSDAVRDTFRYSEEGETRIAFVAFDAANSTLKTLGIASTVGFLVLAGYVAATTVVNLRKKKDLSL